MAEPEEADPAAVDVEMLALPDVDPADIAAMRRTAIATLYAHSADMVDIRDTKFSTVNGRRVDVHFDNCSHSSGKQRVYVACPLKRNHIACFKYRQLEKFESTQHAVAWMTCWHMWAHANPNSTKLQHAAHEPTPADVAAMLPNVSDA